MTTKDLINSDKGTLVLRHGDVGIFSVETLPSDVKEGEKKKSVTLQLGEKTGHKHVLTVEDPKDLIVYEWEGELGLVMRLNAPGTITHEEHATRVIPPGIYIRRQEQEYNPFEKAVRKVVD